MTATIHILPVVRGLNMPDLTDATSTALPNAPDFSSLRKCMDGKVDATQVPYEIALDFAVANKLEDAAELANIDPEKMIQALIVWGLSQVEKMPHDDFYNSLTAVANAKC